MPTEFRNWSGQHACTPAEWAAPTSESEVQALVQRALSEKRRIKVVGAGHSFSDIALTDGILVSIDALDRVLEIDGQRQTVRVQAGKRLRAFCDELAAAGWTLPIVGSIDVQSLAGLTATGTHGSSLVHGNLSSLIAGMRIVNGLGEVIELPEGDPRLAASRVHLGALGIVTELTFRIERMFTLAETTIPLSFNEGVARFLTEQRQSEYTKFWWLPHTDRAQVFVGERSSSPHNFSERTRRFDEAVVNAWVFPFVLWLGNQFPSLIAPLNAITGAVYFKAARTVGVPHRVLTLAMPPRHFEAEWAIPLEHFEVVVAALRELANGLHVNFILEARLVKGDENWMSPAYGRDTVQIGTYITNALDRPAFFSGAAALFAQYGGRPHWGKESAINATQAAETYPRFADFRVWAAEMDPHGVFRNAMLNRLLD